MTAFVWIASLLVLAAYPKASAEWFAPKFVPNACDNIHEIIDGHYIGQRVVVRQILAGMICDHVAKIYAKDPNNPPSPTVISMNGAPGYGKSYLHDLIAKAVYNKDLKTTFAFSYHVIPPFADDINNVTKLVQHINSVKEAFAWYITWARDPVIAIEDYNTFGTASLKLIRQMIKFPDELLSGATKAIYGKTVKDRMKRAIIILTSNDAENEVQQIALNVKPEELDIDEVEKKIKEVVRAKWTIKLGLADAVTFVNAIGRFLPVTQFSQDQVAQYILLLLSYKKQADLKNGITLEFAADIAPWLAQKMNYVGAAHVSADSPVQIKAKAMAYVVSALRDVKPLKSGAKVQVRVATGKTRLTAARL